MLVLLGRWVLVASHVTPLSRILDQSCSPVWVSDAFYWPSLAIEHALGRQTFLDLGMIPALAKLVSPLLMSLGHYHQHGKLVLVKCETFFVSLLCFTLLPPLSPSPSPPPFSLPSPLPPHKHTPHLTSSIQTVSMQCATVLIHRLKCVPELVKVGREREKGERGGEREGRREGREEGKRENEEERESGEIK